MPEPDGRPARARVRRRWLDRRLQFRGLDPRPRVLPDLLIVGAQRAGTTSLYEYLAAHPDVVAPVGKELQYFTLHARRGERWYRSHFPTVAEMERRTRQGTSALAFEATPYYLFHPHAARRAAAAVPSAKVIALVRDPVERAYSHYQHSRQRGLEPLSFEAAVAAEPQRLAGEVEHMKADPEYQSRAHRVFSYVSRGRYAEQLEEWFAHFPREQTLVLRSEDLFATPGAVYGQVLDFVGLRPTDLPDYPAHTRSRPGPALADSTRRELAAAFRRDNERLTALLGRDMAWHD